MGRAREWAFQAVNRLVYNARADGLSRDTAAPVTSLGTCIPEQADAGFAKARFDSFDGSRA
jgi:hypothetical protein